MMTTLDAQTIAELGIVAISTLLSVWVLVRSTSEDRPAAMEMKTVK